MSAAISDVNAAPRARFSMACFSATAAPLGSEAASIHALSAKALTGASVSLARYRGKPMLIENIASL